MQIQRLQKNPLSSMAERGFMGIYSNLTQNLLRWNNINDNGPVVKTFFRELVVERR